MDLKVDYLGLALKNPIIASSSPFTMNIEGIEKLERKGIGAVVLKSIFEEQVGGEVSFLKAFNQYPEAADYLNHYVEDDYLKRHLELISIAKKSVNIPIIASINCLSKDSWIDYAKKIESAGADALELNIFILPVNMDESTASIENRYLDTISEVTSQLKIPVSVKISSSFTNVLGICKGLYYRGAKGVVMFNRFFEPDIDIDNMELINSDCLSCRCDLRASIRNVALCTTQLPALDVAVSTGVHSGEDAIKAILSGAKATQICSTLFRNGYGVIEEMKEFIARWMDRQGFESLAEFRGKLSSKKEDNLELYQRVQYMKFFPKSKDYSIKE